MSKLYLHGILWEMTMRPLSPWSVPFPEASLIFYLTIFSCFPLNLGFWGAALTTALSPVVTMLVCSTHYLGKNNHVEFHWRRPLFAGSSDAASLCFCIFAEISSAVITIIFNMLILRIAGNIGIAATAYLQIFHWSQWRFKRTCPGCTAADQPELRKGWNMI